MPKVTGGSSRKTTRGVIIFSIGKRKLKTENRFFRNFLLTKTGRRSNMALGKTGKRKEVGEKTEITNSCA
jgi:hypothetical protein